MSGTLHPIKKPTHRLPMFRGAAANDRLVGARLGVAPRLATPQLQKIIAPI
jgi:hypothetical protein